MKSYSLVVVVLVGVVLAQADAHRRRYAEDRDSENQVDSTGTSVEEPEVTERPHRRHHEHHGRRHHLGGRHHHRHHHRGKLNLSQAEETIEFHRMFMYSVRDLANLSGLCNNDINTLMNIMEENRPPFKREDRSEWTEEQWAKSKEECNQRKQLIRQQAFEQIQDQVHLSIFFDNLEARKKLMKENIHKYMVGRLTRIARRSGLNDTQIENFIRELESHKPVGVHWRPGMSQNEKRKNVQIYVKNWEQIKEACLRDASESERAQLMRFFAAVEKDFASRLNGDHEGRRHHGHRHHHRRHHGHHHRRHHNDEDYPRRHHHDADGETENIDSEVRHHHRHHRHHRRHHTDDEESEETPRHHHRRQHRRRLETEEEDKAPMRHRHSHRRSDDSEDSEEREQPHRRHHHHHHRRPHHVDNSDDGEEQDEAPRHHHRRHHHHRHHHRQHEENSDNSEEQRDEQPEPRRHHQHHHRRHHHNRHEDNEETDDTKVRSEPYRHYRRHARRSDAAEE